MYTTQETKKVMISVLIRENPFLPLVVELKRIVLPTRNPNQLHQDSRTVLQWRLIESELVVFLLKKEAQSLLPL
jgi:hypothetical protein